MSRKRRRFPARAPTVSASSRDRLQHALTLLRGGFADQAKLTYDQILRAEPRNFEALHWSGVCAMKAGDNEAAAFLITRAIQLNPTDPIALNNHGASLSKLSRHEEALVSYDRSISIDPDYAQAHANRGETLRNLGRLEGALASYDRALQIRPELGLAWEGRGDTLRVMRRVDEAIACYEAATRAQPRASTAYLKLAGLFETQHKFSDALLNYKRSLEGDPALWQAQLHLGYLLVRLGRHQEAARCFESVLQMQPDVPFLLGTYLHTKMRVCDWSDFDALFSECKKRLAAREPVLHPFPAVGLIDDPSLLRTVAEIWVAFNDWPTRSDSDDKPTSVTGHARVHRKEKICVGYYSADFHDHATAYLMAELFELHDRDRFEWHAFSFGNVRNGAMRERLLSSFDKFHDVQDFSDAQIIALSIEMGIDIAIDLKGYTMSERTAIFAGRCAPTQVNYLGFPGTMGAPFIDYMIADRTVVPEQDQRHYSEKIVYLPNSYQVNDRRRAASDRIFVRDDVGLPEAGFVFCCFNNNFKIHPSTFNGWMKILQAVDGSVLWLLEDCHGVADNLRREAEARGIDGRRLVFAPRVALAEHLARYRLADLFLDTLPCNAHTTASDALWMGVPVLTCEGGGFAGRVAASLLRAVGMPELVMSSLEALESRAIELATDRRKLSRLRERLAQNRIGAPLFDCEQFARDIEEALATMHSQSCSRIAPD